MDENDAAMQAMMGFSSFGSNKRHKSNSGNASNRPKKPPSTSSNSTPLGQRLSSTTTPLNQIPASLPPSGGVPVSPPPQPLYASEDSSTNDIGNAQAPIQTALPLLTATAAKFNPNPSTQHATIYPANSTRSDPGYGTAASTSRAAPLSFHQNKPEQQRQCRSQRGYDGPDDEIGYTSPWTGETLTHREIREYGRGKEEVQADGEAVTVFFKPSFVEDPWAMLLGKKEAGLDEVMEIRRVENGGDGNGKDQGKGPENVSIVGGESKDGISAGRI